nr:DUF1223 domain-containing protein [Croceivirga thetidis]
MASNEPENKLTTSNFKPIVVLELFTSQGCSSCPPADVLLDEVKVKYPKDVYALSYHVDYWNYIGWKDPFSQSKFSTKQRFYNSKLRSRGNYTPQLVVNGSEHFVGSNRLKMYNAIESKKNLNPTNQVEIKNVGKKNNTISFNYELLGSVKDKDVRAVLVLNERITKVSRGENRNRTLKNTNIVVAEKYLSNINEKSGIIKIPELVSENDELSLMIIIETSDLTITGAAKEKIN